MEASKGLFVSDAKIIGYMRELQFQQSITGIHPPVVRYSHLETVLAAQLVVLDNLPPPLPLKKTFMVPIWK